MGWLFYAPRHSEGGKLPRGKVYDRKNPLVEPARFNKRILSVSSYLRNTQNDVVHQLSNLYTSPKRCKCQSR